MVRRHLRFGAATWLICHVLAFSALLPRDCCAAHAHGATAATGDAIDHSAHGMAASAEHADHGAVPDHAEGASCPMPGPDGAPCPMHSSGATPAGCQMTGVCNQPSAALAAVLMPAAMPSPVFALLPRGAELVDARSADEQPHTLALPPDSPPPRL